MAKRSEGLTLVYICICNGFRDQDLRKLGASGVRCAETAYAALGSHPKCGACLDSAKGLLEEAAEAACSANREPEAA